MQYGHHLRARLALVGAFVGIVGVACGGSLWLKNVGEEAIRAESELAGLLAETLRQDGLEWRAISGSPPPSLRVELTRSRSRALERLRSAEDHGLPRATARRLANLQSDYSSVVDRELDLLAAGRLDEAAEWDEARVDPLSEALVDELESGAALLRSRGDSLARYSDIGLLSTILLSLAITALVQSRAASERQKLLHDLTAEARYRAIIEDSRDLVIVSDASGRIGYLSPAAERVLSRTGRGLSKDARLDQLMPPDDADHVSALLAAATTEHEPDPVDLRFPTPQDEQARTFQFTARDLSHEPLVAGIVLTGRDVTRDREVEQIMSDFVATVSHELRTPLTSIHGYLELLLAGDLGVVPDEQRAAMEVVDRNAGRLLSLVQQLLFLSGLDARTGVDACDPVDVVELVRSIVTEARVVATTHRIDLDLPSGTDPRVRVLGAAEDLERVFTNLLSNAMKFSPDGEAIAVRVEAGEETVDVHFVDHGIGIPAEEQAKLFDRFFRASAAKSQGIPGTGLGLAVCQAIITAHDGSISVASQPGAGSEFIVSLPRTPGESAEAVSL